MSTHADSPPWRSEDMTSEERDEVIWLEARTALGVATNAARSVDQGLGGLDALRTDMRAESRDRRRGEKLVLEGQQRILAEVSIFRGRLDTIDVSEGERLAREANAERELKDWKKAIDKRFDEFERDSINNEAAIELASKLGTAFVDRAQASDRARADRRALVVDGSRAIGRGVVWITEQREVRLGFVLLVVTAIYLAVRLLGG